MATTEKPPVLVVLQLSGGNDYMNTVVPYNDPLYRDYRPRVALPEDQLLLLDNDVGLHPSMGPMRDMYNQGKMAIIHGVGYPNSVRSHFRSMDIWHTCEPEKTGTEGWLGLATRELDPHKDNIVTAVSFGPCMFRALVGARGAGGLRRRPRDLWSAHRDLPGAAARQDPGAVCAELLAR